MRRYDNNTQLPEECYIVERLHLLSNAPEDRTNGLKLLGAISGQTSGRIVYELSVSGTGCHMKSPSWKILKYMLKGHVSNRSYTQKGIDLIGLCSIFHTKIAIKDAIKHCHCRIKYLVNFQWTQDYGLIILWVHNKAVVCDVMSMKAFPKQYQQLLLYSTEFGSSGKQQKLLAKEKARKAKFN